MRTLALRSAALVSLATLPLTSSRLAAQHSSIHEPGDAPITIHAARMIDGRGHVQSDVIVTVRRGKIERVDVGPQRGAAAPRRRRTSSARRRFFPA
jgi:hypothetical protein